jgi:hypothetical protein
VKDKSKCISVNIWDDYYEDGYVPIGETQRTYMYIEENNMKLQDQEKRLLQIKKYIEDNNLLTTTLSMIRNLTLMRWELYLVLTHKEREMLLDCLIKSELNYNFYSES